MKRFGYVRDPLCVAACGCYGLNRWLLRPLGLAAGPFMRGHFNDLLLIPAALPLLLWFQRRLGVRAGDQAPSWREIGLHFAAWSLAAEVIAPHFIHRATGDWIDVVAYAAGAVVSGCVWQSTASA